LIVNTVVLSFLSSIHVAIGDFEVTQDYSFAMGLVFTLFNHFDFNGICIGS